MLKRNQNQPSPKPNLRVGKEWREKIDFESVWEKVFKSCRQWKIELGAASTRIKLFIRNGSRCFSTTYLASSVCGRRQALEAIMGEALRDHVLRAGGYLPPLLAKGERRPSGGNASRDEASVCVDETKRKQRQETP